MQTLSLYSFDNLYKLGPSRRRSRQILLVAARGELRETSADKKVPSPLRRDKYHLTLCANDPAAI